MTCKQPLAVERKEGSGIDWHSTLRALAHLNLITRNQCCVCMRMEVEVMNGDGHAGRRIAREVGVRSLVRRGYPYHTHVSCWRLPLVSMLTKFCVRHCSALSPSRMLLRGPAGHKEHLNFSSCKKKAYVLAYSPPTLRESGVLWYELVTKPERVYEETMFSKILMPPEKRVHQS